MINHKKANNSFVDTDMFSLSPTMKRLLPIYVVLAFRNIAWMGSVAGPVLPLYVRELGVDIMDWGLMSTSMGVGLILFEGFFGSISDRVDRKNIIILACIGLACIFPLYGLVKIVSYFFYYQLAIGAIAVAIGATSRAMVTDLTLPETRGTYMSLWWGFFTLGSIIGPVLGTYISELLGYEYAFYCSSILLFFGAIFFTLFNKLNGKTTISDYKKIGLVEGFKNLLNIDNIRYAMLQTLLMYISMSSINTFFTIYSSEKLSISNVVIGWMLTTSGIVQLIIIPLIGKLSDRIGQKGILQSGLLISSLSLFIFPHVTTSLELWILNVILSIGFATTSLNLAIVSKDSPENLSGMLMGLYGSFEDLGFIVGPLMFSYIWSNYNPGLIFTIAGVFSLICVPFLMINKENPIINNSK